MKGKPLMATWRRHDVTFPPTKVLTGALSKWRRRAAYMDKAEFGDWIIQNANTDGVGDTVSGLLVSIE